MSFWVELHCDVLDMERKGKTDELACWSHRNANEGALSGNSLNELRATVRWLKTLAKTKGWKNTRKGWSCPQCGAKTHEG